MGAIDELLAPVKDYEDGRAFYNWFKETQGLKFKGQYFTFSLREVSADLVAAVVENGGAGTLPIEPSDFMSYMNFFCSDPPEDQEAREGKFKAHGIELVEFETAWEKQCNSTNTEK